MAKKQTKEKTGKLDPNKIRDMINKKLGREVAFDLNEENPTEVTEWISTGSTWLDSIICRGSKAGIPVGKISELAGESSSGKSYMAAQIAANAQKQGIDVVYFDSESAIDPSFLTKAGCNVERLIYVQAESVEFVLETIEDLLANNESQMLFVWDSMALTPSKRDLEGDFDPNGSMAVKPRILSLGLSKLIQPIANTKSTLLILNQLKTNLSVQGNVKYLTDSERYTTPGGKALTYSYSLRVWLTGRRAKDSFVLDEHGFRTGSSVKARLEKSRFGTQGRECLFKISWAGEHIGVLDDESLFEALSNSPNLEQSGAWYGLKYSDGTTEKFQAAGWLDKMKTPKFRQRVLELLEEEVIVKFENKSGDAKNFYNVEGVESVEE
jgi:recombination protein RecA